MASRVRNNERILKDGRISEGKESRNDLFVILGFSRKKRICYLVSTSYLCWKWENRFHWRAGCSSCGKMEKALFSFVPEGRTGRRVIQKWKDLILKGDRLPHPGDLGADWGNHWVLTEGIHFQVWIGLGGLQRSFQSVELQMKRPLNRFDYKMNFCELNSTCLLEIRKTWGPVCQFCLVPSSLASSRYLGCLLWQLYLWDACPVLSRTNSCFCFLELFTSSYCEEEVVKIWGLICSCVFLLSELLTKRGSGVECCICTKDFKSEGLTGCYC